MFGVKFLAILGLLSFLAVPGLLSLVSAAQAVDLRVREDPERDRRWVLRPSGVHLYRLGTGQYLRHIPLAGWYWAGEPYGCAPDLAIGPRGEALVTSDIAPVVWRVDPRSLTGSVRQILLDADAQMDVGFSGLLYSPEKGEYLAVSHIGSLWALDRGLTRARKIRLSAPMARACGISNRPRLCVRGEDRDWAVELAPDGRSASVSPTPLCGPREAGAAADSGRSTGR
jgi:hypothetical protein